MATPAFIYACDDLGPDRFTELCGLLLGSRYKGFLLGGMGSDGGIDGEIDDILGEWYPETGCALLTELIQPHQLVIFQFKHKVTARVGQKEARRKLLALYTCTSQAHPCELHRLLQNKKPGAYVLLTNVEVNAQFRTKFIRACEQHCPAISHYQIIGLDELEMWVRSEADLRHHFFPTLFGLPRFFLRIQLSQTSPPDMSGYPRPGRDGRHSLLIISIHNTGMVASYISKIGLDVLVDGKRIKFTFLDFARSFPPHPETEKPLEPGQPRPYPIPVDTLHAQLKSYGENVVPVEVFMEDGINNVYSTIIPNDIVDWLLSYPGKPLKWPF